MNLSDSEEEDKVGEMSTPVSPSKLCSSPNKRKTILRSRRMLCKQPSTSELFSSSKDVFRPQLKFELSSLWWFRSLKPQAQNTFIESMSINDFLEDTLLFKEGGDCQGLYVVCRGTVSCIEEGRETAPEYVKPYDLIGLTPLLLNIPNINTAAADAGTRIVFLTAEDFDYIFPSQIKEQFKKKKMEEIYREKLKMTNIMYKCPRELSNNYVRLFKIMKFKKGDVIIHMNTEGDFLYSVIEGNVNISIPNPLLPNERITFRTIYPNEFMGEVALINNVLRTADCIANTDVVIMALHKVVFSRIFDVKKQLWEGAYSLLFGTQYCSNILSQLDFYSFQNFVPPKMKKLKDLFQYIYVNKTGRDLYFRTFSTLKADKRSIISVGLAYKYLNFLHDFSDRRKYICVNRMRAIVYEAYNETEEEVPDCYWDIVKVVLEQTTLFKRFKTYFTHREIRAICRCFQYEDFATCDLIYDYGDNADYIGILLTGTARVLVQKKARDPFECIVILSSGDSFGTALLYGCEYRVTRIIAMSHCEVLMVPFQRFVDMLCKNDSNLTHLPSIEDKLTFCKSMNAFSHYKDINIRELATALKPLPYQYQMTLFEAGQKTNDVYFLYNTEVNMKIMYNGEMQNVMDIGKGQVIGLSALDQTKKAVEKYTTTVSKSGWILVLEKQYFSFLDEKSRQKIRQKLTILEDLFDMRLKEIDKFQNELDKTKPYKTLKLEHPVYTLIKVKINSSYNEYNEQRRKMFKEKIPKVHTHKPLVVERTRSRYIDISYLMRASFEPVKPIPKKKKPKTPPHIEIDRKSDNLKYETDPIKQKLYQIDNYFNNLRLDTFDSYTKVNNNLLN